MFLSKKEKMAKEKQIHLQNKFNLALEFFWDTYPKEIFTYVDFETYKNFVENNDVLSCIILMKDKYHDMFKETLSFEEQEKIITSIKVLTKFMGAYSKELITDNSDNQKFQKTKELLLEKAKTFLSKEIEDYKKEKEQRILKEKQVSEEREAKRDQLFDDIKNL